MSTQPALARRLGTVDAVFIGLSAMIGAGIFSAFAPAAQAAGTSLLIGLLVAAFVAFCNATSSAQLAAQYPVSGGTYVYGREQLGPWWGFMAGWSFVIGKTASCAAMALVFAYYVAPVAPAGWQRPLAVVAVVALGAVNYFGVTKTALAAKIIVIFVLLVLLLVVVLGMATGYAATIAGHQHSIWPLSLANPYGILQSAGLLFFAFAGYARIATMGEEVREPRKTIPRAITIALVIVVVLYGVVGVIVIQALGIPALIHSTAPLADTVAHAVTSARSAVSAGNATTFSAFVGLGWAVPVVRIGAAVACLGALLALLAGIGRTTLAMAREGDLPRGLAAVHPRFAVPYRAEIAITLVVAVIVLFADVRDTIGFSSFGVLLYYFVANVAALRQRDPYRRYPRPIAVLGSLGCLILVATLPAQAIVIGVIVVGAGLVYRVVYRLVYRAQRKQLQ